MDKWIPKFLQSDSKFNLTILLNLETLYMNFGDLSGILISILLLFWCILYCKMVQCTLKFSQNDSKFNLPILLNLEAVYLILEPFKAF
jgi:hypothetical protein